MLQPAPPTAEFNIKPPKLSEVRQVVKKARSLSAPGPNGVLYKLYKNCPKVLELLRYLMRTAWRSSSQRKQTPKDVGQFRNIALLNVEGKVFFSVLARRITTYLLENGYINTNCHTVGVPGFPGCVEYSTLIWDQIQKARQEKTCISSDTTLPTRMEQSHTSYAMEFFYMPFCIKNLVAGYSKEYSDDLGVMCWE